MRIKRSAIIIYSSATEKKEMRNSKLINYKNKRYIEMMKELVEDYDEVMTADIDEDYSEKSNSCEDYEKRAIKCIYRALKKVDRNDKVLIISSDMPLIHKELINYMGKIEFSEDILIPYANNEFQKFCAVYDKKILKNIEYILENEEISFNNLFNNTSIRYIFPKDKSMFISVDKLEKYITYYM